MSHQLKFLIGRFIRPKIIMRIMIYTLASVNHLIRFHMIDYVRLECMGLMGKFTAGLGRG